MDRKATTLEEYFSKLRETPAITSAELHAMVDSPVHHPWYRLRSRRGMHAGVAAVAAGAMIAGAALLSGGGDGNGKPKRKHPAKTASATARPARNGESGERKTAAAKGGLHPAPSHLGPLYTEPDADTVEVSDAPVSVHSQQRVPVSMAIERPSTTVRTRIEVDRRDALIMKDERIEVKIPKEFENLKYVLPVDSVPDRIQQTSSHRKPAIRLTSGANAVPATISGVRMTELNDDELAQLGVYIRPNGSVMVYSTGTTRSSREGSVPSQSYIACTFTAKGAHTVTIDRSEIPSGIKPVGFPVYVTDVKGARKIFDQTPSTIQLASEVRSFVDSLDRIELARPYSIGNLIPVRINLRDRVMDASELNFERLDDLVFWYRPSSKLLERLPSCMREEVKSEIAVVTELLRHDMQSGADLREELAPDMRRIYDSLRAQNRDRLASCRSAASDRMAGAPYLDAWRSRAGAILSTSVSPNSVGDDLNINYSLGAPRTVTIDLYDVLGRHERNLLKKASMDKGNFGGTYSLVGIPAGIYLVVITTNREEQAVQRVVVE